MPWWVFCYGPFLTHRCVWLLPRTFFSTKFIFFRSWLSRFRLTNVALLLPSFFYRCSSYVCLSKICYGPFLTHRCVWLCHVPFSLQTFFFGPWLPCFGLINVALLLPSCFCDWCASYVCLCMVCYGPFLTHRCVWFKFS